MALNKKKIMKELTEAGKRVYSFATTDLAYKLGKAAMGVGIYKIQWFLDKVGSDKEDIVAVFGPDGTITMNTGRFESGVGYGCVVSTRSYMFPTLLKPNACGFGLFKINDFDYEQVLKNHQELKRNGVQVDDKTEVMDTSKSNHFISILNLEEVYKERYGLDQGFYVIIHSSPQSFKEKLYNWDSGDLIKERTPLGEVEGLSGGGAKDYLSFFKKAEEVSKMKRIAIAEKLFGSGNVETICNPTHQGYFEEGGRYTMRLGIHNSLDLSSEGKRLFPIGFNSYSPIFLYSGKKNINKKFWTVHQLERADEQKCRKVIEEINILPHGGGYSLHLPYTEVEYEIRSKNVLYTLFNPLIKGRLTISHPTNLEYRYREPNEVLPLIRLFELGEKVAMLHAAKILKI